MDEPHAEPSSDPLPRVADLDAPPGLEARLRAALVSERLLQPRRRPNWRLGVGVAAGFVIGVLVGMSATRSPAPTSADARYMLLLYPGDGAAHPVVDRDSSALAHREWLVALRTEGRVIRGDRLSPDAPALVGSTSDNAPLVPQGYFVATATSIDDAVRVAASSPHVKAGGRIVVQAIDTPR